MTNVKSLLPMQPNIDSIPNVKYLEGFPVQYRFNASQGIFTHKGQTALTKKGEAFTIIPIAYRQFSDDILGMGKKAWIEFFFLNRANQVCSLLLHGYSVENLSGIVADLYYAEAHLFQVALSIKPVQKETKSGSKYFIAEYDFAIINEQDEATLYEATKDFKIYRKDILTGDAEMKLSYRYFNPLKQLKEA